MPPTLSARLRPLIAGAVAPGPGPRIIDDAAWAKLMAAGLTLTADVLRAYGTPWAKAAGWHANYYPIDIICAWKLLRPGRGLLLLRLLRQVPPLAGPRSSERPAPSFL
ncbi:hypothetical protein ACLQ18_02310 [Streptomyces sp. DT193]|uniref:hypothetical protein n=1 Tax=Streptomyces sp. DT193 TaxID=3393418 RepID=UPI003CF01F94